MNDVGMLFKNITTLKNYKITKLDAMQILSKVLITYRDKNI